MLDGHTEWQMASSLSPKNFRLTSYASEIQWINEAITYQVIKANYHSKLLE